MKHPGLEVGAQGEAVSRLQVALCQAGYRIPQSEAARRFFGPGTRNAITQYQQDHALPVDGRADPATLALLTASPPREPADTPGAAATSAPGKADRPSGSVLPSRPASDSTSTADLDAATVQARVRTPPPATPGNPAPDAPPAPSTTLEPGSRSRPRARRRPRSHAHGPGARPGR